MEKHHSLLLIIFSFFPFFDAHLIEKLVNRETDLVGDLCRIFPVSHTRMKEKERGTKNPSIFKYMHVMMRLNAQLRWIISGLSACTCTHIGQSDEIL